MRADKCPRRIFQSSTILGSITEQFETSFSGCQPNIPSQVLPTSTTEPIGYRVLVRVEVHPCVCPRRSRKLRRRKNIFTYEVVGGMHDRKHWTRGKKFSILTHSKGSAILQDVMLSQQVSSSITSCRECKPGFARAMSMVDRYCIGLPKTKHNEKGV